MKIQYLIDLSWTEIWNRCIWKQDVLYEEGLD